MEALRALVRHGGSWPGGWKWTNESTTVRLLNSLVKRGLATVSDSGHGDRYTVTDAGREAAKDALTRRLEAARTAPFPKLP